MDTLNFLFFIKQSKLLRDGKAPIYLRITVNGERAEVGIKRSVHPKDWSAEGQRITLKTKEAR